MNIEKKQIFRSENEEKPPKADGERECKRVE